MGIEEGRDDCGLESDLAEDHLHVPVRSDIPLRHFPDYVLEMTEETEYRCSKLANEYQASAICYNYISYSKINMLF